MVSIHHTYDERGALVCIPNFQFSMANFPHTKNLTAKLLMFYRVPHMGTCYMSVFGNVLILVRGRQSMF